MSSKIIKPKACLVCRQRKIKCDAHLREGVRCTNCAVANIAHCIIPKPKKRESKKLKQILTNHPELSAVSDNLPIAAEEEGIHLNPSDMLKGKLDILAKVEHHSGFISVPFTAHLLSDFIRGHPEKFPEYFTIDPVDLNYLKSLQCFTLPNLETCNKYIDTYFTIMHPQFPVVNEHQFRTDYFNIENGDFPSLTLLQSIIYVGSFFYCEPDWTPEQQHQQKLKSKSFYKRAKALLDLNIEVDAICQIQSELIINKYWYTVTNFKTTGFAYISSCIAKAYSLGMQRDQSKNSSLTTIEKRLFKRIWWSLYIKDSFMSNLAGRPYTIDERDVTISMVEPDDMIDTIGSDQTCPLSGLFFIERVKLSMGSRLISKNIAMIEHNSFQPGQTIESLLKECDQFLLKWIEKLPKELLFHSDKGEKNSTLSATLAIEYYSLLLMVHKVHIFQIQPNNDIKVSYPYSSWAITFKSCHMISIIGKYFQTTGATFLYPATICGFVTFAGTMLMYQMYNHDEKIVELARTGIENCIGVLGSMKIGWPFASLFHFFLKSFYEDKEKRIIIIKRMLRHGSKSQLRSSNGINSKQTMEILDNRSILPKIPPIDNSKLKPAFIQNIFKCNQVLNDNNNRNSKKPNLWQTPLPSISPLPLSQTLGISLATDNYQPQHYRQRTPDISLRGTQMHMYNTSPPPSLHFQPLPPMNYSSLSMNTSLNESGTNINALMRTFDEVMPSNTLPNLTGSEWHPQVSDIANMSDHSYDFQSSGDEPNNYVNELTLFSRLGGSSYGDIMNDLDFGN